MTSSYYSREYVDIANHNSYSSKKSITVSAYSSSSPNYYYFTCYESGSYTIYANHSSGDFYITVYNATRGSYIINSYNLYGSYPSKSATFTANAGDVIYVKLYKYNSNSLTGYGTFYVTNASYPTSTATAKCTAIPGYVYEKGTTSGVDVKYGSQLNLPTPTRPGYTLLGWYNGDTPIESGIWSTASNMTLTPKWQANTNVITLDADSGTVSENSVNVTYNENYTLPEPTKTGYTFDGWYNDETKYTGGTWNGLEDITLVAKWVANTYTVTYEDTAELNVEIKYNYNYNGSPSVTYGTSELENGETLSYFPTLTRSGYVFTGWYTTEDCTEKYSFSGTITEDMTLYAGWEEMTLSSVYSETQINPTDYTSSSDYYSVSTSGTSSSSKRHIYMLAQESGIHYIYWKNYSSSSSYGYYLQIYNLTKGTTIRSLSNTYSTSYNYTSFNCSAGDIIVISLYRYNTNYSSTAYFYFNGFTTPFGTATVDCIPYGYSEGSTSSTAVTFGSSYTLPELTRSGYSFLGWYNGDEKIESGNWSLASDVTLIPKWEAVPSEPNPI
jgi:uncharacterized repeat protein (TIGR02543 family)